MSFGNARWAQRLAAGALAATVWLVAAPAAAQARDGFYLDVHLGPGVLVNGRDDGARAGPPNDGVETGYAFDGGLAVGAAPRPGLALAGQVSVLGGEARDFTIIGHAGPMIDLFAGPQRTWHLQAGASFALGWFGHGNDLNLPAPDPIDTDLLGVVAYVGGGAALPGEVAPGLFVRTHGVALFGDDTRYYALVLSGGVDLMVF
jgi:hypothetical protein